MAVNTSKNSDDYKKEIVKPISTNTNTNTNTNKIDQPTTSEKVNPDDRDTKESKMQGKSESIKDKTSGKISEFVEATESEDKVHLIFMLYYSIHFKQILIKLLKILIQDSSISCSSWVLHGKSNTHLHHLMVQQDPFFSNLN